MHRSHSKLSTNTHQSQLCCPTVFQPNFFRKSAADVLRLLSTTLIPLSSLFRAFYTPPACIHQAFSVLTVEDEDHLESELSFFVQHCIVLAKFITWCFGDKRNKHQFCSKCAQSSLKGIYETHFCWKNYSNTWVRAVRRNLQNNCHRFPAHTHTRIYIYIQFCVKQSKNPNVYLAWSSPRLPSHPPTGKSYNLFYPYRPSKHKIFSPPLCRGWP